ncbi:hypothetical protein AA101099_0249 [Neoasaia chiangmaiensis NBRC 101099]|nr:hypothetical protein AA101099_0249 [Neoasaia chiangmaiensis NBRC 101099]
MKSGMSAEGVDTLFSMAGAVTGGLAVPAVIPAFEPAERNVVKKRSINDSGADVRLNIEILPSISPAAFSLRIVNIR